MAEPQLPAIVESAETALLEYDSVDKLAALFDSLGWSLDEEIALYVETARCSDNPNVRMKALAALRKVRQDILKLSGAIGEVKATRFTKSADGATIAESIVASLIRKGGSLDADFSDPTQHKRKRVRGRPKPHDDAGQPAGDKEAPAAEVPETKDNGEPVPDPDLPSHIPGLSAAK